jgi:hypothetical protein
LQNAKPIGHAHVPPAHDDPPVHALPHSPQSSLLVDVSTQTAPHIV